MPASGQALSSKKDTVHFLSLRAWACSGVGCIAHAAAMQVDRFLLRNPEKPELNQYWYSKQTVLCIAEEVSNIAKRAAFLSTPSIYFSLSKNSDVRKQSCLFDLDNKFATEPGFICYDFQRPEDIPSNVHHAFDCVIIDPPFITEEVWRLYAAATKLLLAQSGKIIATTIAENAALLKDLLGVCPQPYKPCIPHLVFQYDLYTNYSSARFSQPNAEIATD